MAIDEADALRAKARAWQAEADIGIASMRPTYQRMADAFTRMAGGDFGPSYADAAVKRLSVTLASQPVVRPGGGPGPGDDETGEAARGKSP